MIEPVSTRPAIQCHSTQANVTPTIGRNAVNSSMNIDAAITQWNIRAMNECRSIFVRQILVLGFERVGFGLAALAVRRQNHVARVRDEKHQPGEQRRPQQVPGDVSEDRLPPRIASPRQEIHSLPPKMALGSRRKAFVMPYVSRAQA